MSRKDGSTRPVHPSAEHHEVRHQQVGHQHEEREQLGHQAVLYAVDELPARDLAQFEAHLAQCAECRIAVEEQRRIEAVIADASVSTPAIATLDDFSRAETIDFARRAEEQGLCAARRRQQ